METCKCIHAHMYICIYMVPRLLRSPPPFQALNSARRVSIRGMPPGSCMTVHDAFRSSNLLVSTCILACLHLSLHLPLLLHVCVCERERERKTKTTECVRGRERERERESMRVCVMRMGCKGRDAKVERTGVCRVGRQTCLYHAYTTSATPVCELAHDSRVCLTQAPVVPSLSLVFAYLYRESSVVVTSIECHPQLLQLACLGA